MNQVTEACTSVNMARPTTYSPLIIPMLLRHRPIANDVVADPALQLLHIAPAIGSAVFQPENLCCRVAGQRI